VDWWRCGLPRIRSASSSVQWLCKETREGWGARAAAPETGMEWLEKDLREKFDLPPKNRSEEALRRWRDAVSVVKNPRRRFRMVADLATRRQNDLKRRSTQVRTVPVPLLLLLLRLILLIEPLLLALGKEPGRPHLCFSISLHWIN
jgi:hypothetical protein